MYDKYKKLCNKYAVDFKHLFYIGLCKNHVDKLGRKGRLLKKPQHFSKQQLFCKMSRFGEGELNCLKFFSRGLYTATL